MIILTLLFQLGFKEGFMPSFFMCQLNLRVIYGKLLLLIGGNL